MPNPVRKSSRAQKQAISAAAQNKEEVSDKTRSNNRRGPIIEAAARLFATQGFEATTMRDIANQAGILVGSIYYHFPSKEELFVAGYAAGMTYVQDAVLRAIVDETDPMQRLEKAIIAHCEALNHEDAILNIMMPTIDDALGEHKVTLTRMRDKYDAIFAKLLADLELAPGLDPKVFRLNLLGTMNYTRFWFRPGRKSASQIGREIFKTYSQALRPRP